MTRALLFALGAIACVEADPTEDLLVECEFETTEVPWEAAAPHGTVPADVLAFAEGDHEALGAWAGGEEDVRVDFTLHRRGEHAYFQEATEGGCFSVLELPLTLDFITDDGAFDEALEVRGVVEGGALTVRAPLDPEGIVGTYVPEPGEGEIVRGLALEATFAEAGPWGSVLLQTEGQDSEVAWAGEEPVFSW